MIQAGIEAKKAELQKQREADAAAPEPQDDVPAGTPERVAVVAEGQGLAEQAAGRPAGTTGPEVPQTMDGRVEDVPVAAASAAGGNAGDVPAGTPQPEKVTDAEALLALAQDALAAEQSAHPSTKPQRLRHLPVGATATYRLRPHDEIQAGSPAPQCCGFRLDLEGASVHQPLPAALRRCSSSQRRTAPPVGA